MPRRPEKAPPAHPAQAAPHQWSPPVRPIQAAAPESDDDSTQEISNIHMTDVITKGAVGKCLLHTIYCGDIQQITRYIVDRELFPDNPFLFLSFIAQGGLRSSFFRQHHPDPLLQGLFVNGPGGPCHRPALCIYEKCSRHRHDPIDNSCL